MPTSSGWSGPTVTAASADATTAATSLSTALRSGDYQIGLNAFQAEGYPAQISFYRDATFALGYTSYFDAGSRLTYRADRTTRAFDSDVVPGTRDPGAFAQELLAYEARSSAPLLNGVSSPRPPASSDGLFSSRDLELDITSTEGFGGGIESVARYTYTRDAGGRVTSRAHRFSTALLASEPIAQASFDAVTTTYAYRPDGRVGSVRNVDGATGTSTLTFFSNFTTRDVSTVQGEHAFTYDARGLVATQTDFDGTYRYAYDEVGRNTRLEYPDGHARVQVFDDLGRITSRCYRYTSGPLDRCYSAEYDAVGNPVRLVDPEGSDELAYDALDRLTRLTRKDAGGAFLYAEDYAYNALGALRTHAGVAVDHQRPRLSGGGLADAAVPATLRGSAVNLDLGGRVTLLGGNTFGWDYRGQQRRIDPPVPLAPIHSAFDPMGRRAFTIGTPALGGREFYLYEGVDRIAAVDSNVEFPNGGAPKLSFLFDGVDHPLRVATSLLESQTSPPPPASPSTITTRVTPAVLAYYELDLAGNVRRLRARDGADLGGYRYSAFGRTIEDTVVRGVTPNTVVGAPEQPLRWKGMWRFDVNGTELYDARARLWAPELGTFLSIDEYAFQDRRTTLWGWPAQSPFRWRDPSGHFPEDRYAGMQQDEIAATNSGAGVGATLLGALLAGLFAPEAMPGFARALGLGGFLFAATQVQSSDDVAGHAGLGMSLGGMKGMPGGTLGIDCRAASKASIIARGEGNLVEMLPAKGTSLPNTWKFHVAHELPSGAVLDPKLGASFPSVDAWREHVAGSTDVIISRSPYPSAFGPPRPGDTF